MGYRVYFLIEFPAARNAFSGVVPEPRDIYNVTIKQNKITTNVYIPNVNQESGRPASIRDDVNAFRNANRTTIAMQQAGSPVAKKKYLIFLEINHWN